MLQHVFARFAKDPRADVSKRCVFLPMAPEMSRNDGGVAVWVKLRIINYSLHINGIKWQSSDQTPVANFSLHSTG